jgi:hypothetical protein
VHPQRRSRDGRRRAHCLSSTDDLIEWLAGLERRVMLTSAWQRSRVLEQRDSGRPAR